ncbi:hypothetical protein [Streptomyces sp. S4.7]|uniref:hypothetical protein n=1 Tax=Streptomyces sp. S4.7 TaxID=2705439 RepID=UPI0013DA969A|nr:hypothetical protein [Streptomyces sp. S4.7]
MKHETPRDTSGAKVCAWCGGPIKQSGVGRSRDYCGRTHRELAYRERATQKRIAQAIADASPVTSTDEVPGRRDTSTDEIRPAAKSSTDETRPPLPPLTEWLPIREPSPDLDARLDALAGPDEPDDDPDPVPPPVRRSSVPLPPPGPRGKRLFPPFPAGGRACPESEPPTLFEDDPPPAG